MHIGIFEAKKENEKVKDEQRKEKSLQLVSILRLQTENSIYDLKRSWREIQ